MPFVEENVRIAPYTSMKVGGPVRYLFRPESAEDLLGILREHASDRTPPLVVGNASNLLFSDNGYDGCVILTGGIRGMSVSEQGIITALAGDSLTALSRFAMEHGRKGLAFAYGSPGTVGGGVYMNAGAYGGQISDCLVQAVCADANGQLSVLSNEDLDFSYRHSALQTSGRILLSASFACPEEDPAVIREDMERNMRARVEKQPLDYPSCGSVFKRPEGHYAGALIEQAGLKGCSVGGAKVSEKHAGFIINAGDATSSDVRELIRIVQETVERKTGVLLEPEICILPD
ncbi:MAG: UDP-N-acetylmuramate dehydrogenase [Clostridia bacterium]|nr:UDP-N-acetylmuramate dehydrogenase [Clostridia bacterium]